MGDDATLDIKEKTKENYITFNIIRGTRHFGAFLKTMAFG